jgi:hypothetical protein
MRISRVGRFLLSASALSFFGPGVARAAETIVYSYDALGRLVVRAASGVPNNAQAQSFCFDAAGNRIQVTSDGTSAVAACVAAIAPPPTPAPTPSPTPTAPFVVVPIAGYALIYYQQ